MDITQHLLDLTGLVVLVGHDGLVQWSSKRSIPETVSVLRSIADGIEAESLQNAH